MKTKKTFAWLALPSIMGALGWAQYRKAVDELDRYQPASPILPGSIHKIPTPDGVIGYRRINGDQHRPPLVLIHGWGRTGDSAWWPIVWATDRTVIIVDLPGHGRSTLHAPFTLDVAANAVIRVIKHAELDRPAIVGHSMGGAISLLVARRIPEMLSHVGILASSAQWIKPRAVVTLAAAPYVMAPRSPIVIRRQQIEAAEIPNEAGRVVWEYQARPHRRLLHESAKSLRSFDATGWDPTELPPITWVVATEDGIIDPDKQRWSAEVMGASMIEIKADHSLVLERPQKVARLLDNLGMHLPQPTEK